MCGIAGFITSDLDFLQATKADALAHRGPDDFGTFEHERLKLIHYRLSILDLSPNGHQPMISPDGRFALIYNGELYNHLELRKQLNSRFSFHSTSDAETVLYAYMEWGTKAFCLFNGIFALAIYDVFKHELILVRDPLGVKPLYYYHQHDAFAFASELKALIDFPGFDKRLDFSSFASFIQFLYRPGSSTPFLKVKKLPPGTCLTINLDRPQSFHLDAYYQWPPIESKPFESEKKAVDALEQLMCQVVERQMLADVPVGFFVSGGIDSSLLAAIARKIYPQRPFIGFTISQAFEKAEGFSDDLPYARMIARQLDFELHERSAQLDIDNELDSMVWMLDEPQADAAPLLLERMSAEARKLGIPVLLSGIGGDDVFSGYRRHQALKADQFLTLLPIGLRRAMKWTLQSASSMHRGLRRMHRFADGLDFESLEQRMVHYMEWLPWMDVQHLFSKDIQQAYLQNNPSLELLNDVQTNVVSGSPLQKALYLECRYFVPDHNLNYSDKMGMKHAVEIRVPYLDKELIEFGFQLPDALRMKGLSTKYILRKLAERYLPKEIIHRSKTGFGGPVRKWISHDLRGRIQRDLDKQFLLEQGIFNPDAVQSLLNQNDKHIRDLAYPIFALLTIQSWLKQFRN